MNEKKGNIWGIIGVIFLVALIWGAFNKNSTDDSSNSSSSYSKSDSTDSHYCAPLKIKCCREEDYKVGYNGDTCAGPTETIDCGMKFNIAFNECKVDRINCSDCRAGYLAIPLP